MPRKGSEGCLHLAIGKLDRKARGILLSRTPEDPRVIAPARWGQGSENPLYMNVGVGEKVEWVERERETGILIWNDNGTNEEESHFKSSKVCVQVLE